MSFDLVVFDPDTSYLDQNDLKNRIKATIDNQKQARPSDATKLTPPLVRFFKQLCRDFPPLNLSMEDQNKLIGKTRVSFGRERVKKLINSFQNKQYACHNENQTANLAEYSFHEAVIRIGFSWSASELAFQKTLEAALYAGVGFYNISSTNSHPIVNRCDLQKLLAQFKTSSIENISKSAVFELLKEEGWVIKRDPEDGSQSAIKSDEENVYVLFPYFRRAAEGLEIDWVERWAPKELLQAISFIDDQHDVFYPVTIPKSTRIRKFRDIEGVRLGLLETFENLKGSSSDKALEAAANLPNTSSGSLPLVMLAAKACRKDETELRRMRDEMKAGNRQGLVPYIQLEHLDRALVACAKFGANR